MEGNLTLMIHHFGWSPDLKQTANVGLSNHLRGTPVPSAHHILSVEFAINWRIYWIFRDTQVSCISHACPIVIPSKNVHFR